MDRDSSPKDSLDTGVMELDDSLMGTENGDDDVETAIDSTCTMDELMSALDVLEGHADDNIMASRNTEIYWIQTLNQRDQLILANTRSIEDLTRLNDKLKEENSLLKEQMENIEASESGSTIQDESKHNRQLSIKLKSELDELQSDAVTKLKEQKEQLQQQLDRSSESYGEIFSRLRQERLRQNQSIANLCDDLQSEGRRSRSDEEQRRLRAQLEELCQIYDNIISSACDECQEFLHTIDDMEHQKTRDSSVSPRRIRPSSGIDTDKYYAELLHASEKSNQELRGKIENLNIQLNEKEQQMFGATMTRMDNTNRDQIEKLKAQIAELSQELSLQNVDNRALRERLLKTENENEALTKQMNESTNVSDELRSLQSNLNSQLAINNNSESRIKELELIRMEHSTLCERAKADLFEASEKVVEYEAEIKELREKVREVKSLQQKFDHMNFHLNNKMEWLQNENTVLMDEVSKVQREVGSAQQITTEDNQKQAQLLETIKQQEDAKTKHNQEMKELQGKLDATEKQKTNANLKVKALRDRLKSMQDSWQKISADTESSFTALREQYQQQIKEYKSIIDSLKSQNTSLNARIESMKKVATQTNTSNNGNMNNLEQQISEYQQITDGYRQENILLRKELRGIVTGLQEEEKEKGFKSRFTQRDEFARLRDILTTAKTECESLTLHKTPRSRTNTAEKEFSIADSSKSLNSTRQSSVNVRDLKDQYERLSPDYTAPKSSAVTAKPPRTPEKPNYERPWNRYRVLNDVGKSTEPLANSTPRASKSADTLHYQPRHESTRLSTSADSRISGFKTSSHMPSMLSSTILNEKAKLLPLPRTKYDSPGNTKSQENEPGEKHSSNNTRPVTVITPPQSKTKEVIELKHRNSTELDPSKSFKPINPDNGVESKTSKTSSLSTSTAPYQPISSYKPSFLSPDYRSSYSSSAYKSSYQPASYQPTYQPRGKTSYDATKPTSHERPYHSKYEPSYRSKYDSYKSSYDYKDTSVDSAYGSPSRSYTSKQPSLSSYSTSYRRDPLMSLSTLHNKYSGSSMSNVGSRANDSLNKQLDYEISQSAQIHRTLNELEHSITSASSIANADRHEKGFQNRDTNKYGNSIDSSRYTLPYSRVDIVANDNSSKNRHTNHKSATVNFSGTAILYNSIY